ncbi:hypothetical protein GGR35_002823 [Mucilaginibacter phyllosphaerae]|uniref:Uncharacterized protein n=1 Tax=Mucilaginibacter phyllosphaerae TaxID=1812349 RepID=A0ABR6IB73_9SPHI|nr:hypothetical protein [Mucilaginibacter phyllosphaerae]
MLYLVVDDTLTLLCHTYTIVNNNILINKLLSIYIFLHKKNLRAYLLRILNIPI